jgi:ADP-heptose:LPS heptosyltransferase
MTTPTTRREGNAVLPAPFRRWLASRLARTSGSAPADWVDAAIFKLDRLGDFVLALGAIRLLLRHHGEERCVLVISEAAAELAAAEFPRTPRVVLPVPSGAVLRDWWPLRRRHLPFFERTGFGTLINLSHQLAPYHRLVLGWCQHRRWIGLQPAPRPGADLLSEDENAWPAGYPQAGIGPLCAEMRAHLQVCEASLARAVGAEEVLPRLDSIAASRGDYLLVCPFASSSIRNYPGAALVNALRQAQAHEGIRLVFAGSASQRAALEDLAAKTEPPRNEVHVAAGTRAFARLVGGARAVLTMDSAGAHLAAALDKPAVILLGGGHPGKFGPWGGPRQQWLTHPLPCYGCSWHCIHPTTLCLTQIEPARIAEALRTALSAG